MIILKKNKFFDLQKDWNQTLITSINQTSATIFQDTLSGGANAIIITPKTEDIFKTLEYMKVNITPERKYYKLGELSGRYQVFVIPDLTEENKIFVCKINDEKKLFYLENYIKIGVIKIIRLTWDDIHAKT